MKMSRCLLTLALCAAIPSTAAADTAALTPETAELLRREIRNSYYMPGLPPELKPESHGTFAPVAGVVAERVSYATQFGLRVPAILYLPETRPPGTRIPGIVIVNGHGGDKYSWYAFYAGMLYARAGAAVLTYDPAGEGERNTERRSGTRAHDQIRPTAAWGRRLAGLMVTDVMQAVSYLANRPEVDPKRIAAAGYSLGSFVLAATCAVDRRIRACVLAGGGNLDGPGGYWDRAKPACVGLPFQSLGHLGDRAAVLYALHAVRGPTMIFNGLEDGIVDIRNHREPFFEDLARRTRQLAPPPAAVFETGFLPDGGHRPYFVTRPVAAWLEQRLDLPFWDAVDIERMPTVRIGDWAKRLGVEIDPLYASGLHEGGTEALDIGAPALGRDALSVLDEDTWRQRRHDFILESWCARVQPDLENGARASTIVRTASIPGLAMRVYAYQVANPVVAPPIADNDWERGTFYTGVMALYRATKDPSLLERAEHWAETNGWQPGPGIAPANSLTCAQTYLDIHAIRREARMIEATRRFVDGRIREERRGREEWFYSDALYVAPPALAQLAKATGDPRYLDYLSSMYWDVVDALFDAQAGLFYRDRRFVPLRTLHDAPVLWSRGNGWVIAGIPLILEHLPADHPGRPRYLDLFRKMARALKPVQGKDGLWRTSLLDADEFPEPDTSGSAFFCYALAWGVNRGHLDADEYLPVVSRAWNGLASCVEPDGKLGWVQRINDRPGPVARSDTHEYGAGALLLAASEMMRLETRR